MGGKKKFNFGNDSSSDAGSASSTEQKKSSPTEMHVSPMLLLEDEGGL
jgi:hypothetical protein